MEQTKFPSSNFNKKLPRISLLEKGNFLRKVFIIGPPLSNINRYYFQSKRENSNQKPIFSQENPQKTISIFTVSYTSEKPQKFTLELREM